MKDVVIPTLNGDLAGTLFDVEPQGNKKYPAVLLLHGWESGQDRMYDIAELLTARGLVCLTFDFRGHGKSLGDLNAISHKGFLDDAIAAYDYLVQLDHVDANAVGTIGSSYGAYISALLSTERAVAWMVMRVPPNHPDEAYELSRNQRKGRRVVPFDRSKLLPWSATRALRAVHVFAGLIMIVESGLDEIIPPKTIANYCNAVADPRRLYYVHMEGAPHSLTHAPEHKKKFNTLVVQWLQSRI
jgi:esterase/lipase